MKFKASIEVTPTVAVSSSIDLKELFKEFAKPEGLALIGALIFFVVLSVFTGGKKGKISTGKVVGVGEKLAATNLALQQIRERKHNRVCGWCGTPQYWWKKDGILKGAIARFQTILGASPTVWLPHMERSCLVLGAPGSGKTYGTIDRLAESFLQQGFPLIVYDKKGDQMKLLAPLAARYGYDVRIFAPGEPYSEVFNPLDFMDGPEDAVMAGQIAAVINANASRGDKNSDEFFSKAADMLAKALIQLAKGSRYPDLATVYCLQSLDNFVNRLHKAVKEKKVPTWVAASFQQYLKAKESEKTIASIETTTVAVFSGFIQRALLPAFIGKSTIPKKISGKQILIFKLDDAKRDVVSPLLAVGLHLAIVSNLSEPRQNPLGIFLDELPSILLKNLPYWINEYRSNGACFVLGVQSLEQLSAAYGENLGVAISSACSTHILYNPANYETAEKYSKRYGNREFTIKNKSISQSKDGRSTSWSDSLQTTPILTPDEILRFPQGKCAITNPGYSSGDEGSIPYILKIPITKPDQQKIKDSIKLWDDQVLPRLLLRSPLCPPEKLEEALALRTQTAERLLGIAIEVTEQDQEELTSPTPSVAIQQEDLPKFLQKLQATESDKSEISERTEDSADF